MQDCLGCKWEMLCAAWRTGKHICRMRAVAIAADWRSRHRLRSLRKGVCRHPGFPGIMEIPSWAGTLQSASLPPSPSGMSQGLVGKLRTTLEMIKFEHSIFALPFALVGAMLAVRGWPTWREVFWLIVAMVGARSAAMTFNRIADRKFDALNPRTRMRALPAGRLTLRFAVGFTVLSCGLLALAAWELSPLAFKLSPLAIAVLLFYSYTKRFTLLSHLVLGIADGLCSHRRLDCPAQQHQLECAAAGRRRGLLGGGIRSDLRLPGHRF